MYVENPRKGMKNHGLSTNGMFLLYSDLYYVWKIGHSCTINVFFLKERNKLMEKKKKKQNTSCMGVLF